MQDSFADVTVGIVTALPVEGAAVRALITDLRRVSVEGDANHYHIGSLASSEPKRPHRIVVTILPQDGTRNASAVSSDLVRSFPSVRCVVMCGIAGGIPAPHDPKKHVRLGDIIVVTEGVVDYDHIRTTDGEDSLRRPVEGMSQVLLRGVRELQVMEYADRWPWQQWLDTGRSPTLAAFARPDDSTDVLVVDGVIVDHPSDRGFHRRPGLPRVHYASIGSADRLLRDPAKRDELARRYRIQAVEMEASGIAAGSGLHSIHWFVVRGVADYCDNRKNDSWHAYASLAAAAYVRALLEQCHPFPVARPTGAADTPPRQRGFTVRDQVFAEVGRSRRLTVLSAVAAPLAAVLALEIGILTDLPPTTWAWARNLVVLPIAILLVIVSTVIAVMDRRLARATLASTSRAATPGKTLAVGGVLVLAVFVSVSARGTGSPDQGCSGTISGSATRTQGPLPGSLTCGVWNSSGLTLPLNLLLSRQDPKPQGAFVISPAGPGTPYVRPGRDSWTGEVSVECMTPKKENPRDRIAKTPHCYGADTRNYILSAISDSVVIASANGNPIDDIRSCDPANGVTYVSRRLDVREGSLFCLWKPDQPNNVVAIRVPQLPNTHQDKERPSGILLEWVVWSRSTSPDVSHSTSAGTPTTRPPAPVGTSKSHNGGSIAMREDSVADIDKEPQRNENYDLQVSPSGGDLLALNGAAMARLTGPKREMSRESCDGVSLRYGPIALADLPVGTQLCIRTSAGRPAMLEIIPHDPTDRRVIAYLFEVWES